MAIKKEFDLVIEWEWLPRTKDVVICTDNISKDFDFSLLARDLAMLEEWFGPPKFDCSMFGFSL